METLKINNEETNSKEKLIEIQNKIDLIEKEIKQEEFKISNTDFNVAKIYLAKKRIKKMEEERKKMEEAEKHLSAKIIKNNIGSMEMKTNKPNQIGWIDNKSKEGKRNEKIDIEKEKIFEINQRTAEKELEERKRAIEGFEKSRTKEEKLTEIKEESGDSKIEGPFIHLNQATRERKYYDKEGKLIEKKEEELKKEIEKEPVDIPEQKKDEEIEEQTESVGEETPKKTTSEKEQEEEIAKLKEKEERQKRIDALKQKEEELKTKIKLLKKQIEELPNEEDETKKLIEQKGNKIETISEEFIKNEIYKSLSSTKNVKKIHNIGIGRLMDKISFEISMRVGWGPFEYKTDITGIFLENNNEDGIKLNIDNFVATASEEKIREAIKKSVQSVNQKMMEAIEEKYKTKVEKLWIEDGQLKASLKK